MTRELVLETSRLALRELRVDDARAVNAYASDPEVVRYLDWGPSTLEDTERFLATARAARDAVPRTAYHLAVVLRSTGRLIGGCRIEVRRPADRGGDIGYAFDRYAWGRGYATEATRALLEFGFDSLELHRIWATCDVRNRASARVLEKLGMRREGHLRQTTRPKGEWRDSYLYAILDPEWREQSSGARPPAGAPPVLLVDLDVATPADVPTLRRLTQLYLYDIGSAVGWDVAADGTFGDPAVIQRFWDFAAGRLGYLIRVEGQLAGFALVREGSYYGDPGTREMSEFFLLRRYRGRGIGERVAVALFDRFPGPWEVRELEGNVAAQRFWHAVIDRYTAGAFAETRRTDARFSGTVQHFASGREGRAAPGPDAAPSG
jgi:ribosomal-protein-alanine N-acetyltransferase